MEDDNLWWKKTLDRRQLWWKTTIFDERSHLMEDGLWRKIVTAPTQPQLESTSSLPFTSLVWRTQTNSMLAISQLLTRILPTLKVGFWNKKQHNTRIHKINNSHNNHNNNTNNHSNQNNNHNNNNNQNTNTATTTIKQQQSTQQPQVQLQAQQQQQKFSMSCDTIEINLVNGKFPFHLIVYCMCHLSILQ